MTDGSSVTSLIIEANNNNNNNINTTNDAELVASAQQPKPATSRGFHRSSCSIVYRKRVIAFRKAKMVRVESRSVVRRESRCASMERESLTNRSVVDVQNSLTSSPSKDRVSPTSTLGFPPPESAEDVNDIDDDDNSNNVNDNDEPVVFDAIPVSAFQPVLPPKPLEAALIFHPLLDVVEAVPQINSSQSGIHEDPLALFFTNRSSCSTAALPSSSSSSRHSTGSRTNKASVGVDDTDTVLYSQSFPPFDRSSGETRNDPHAFAGLNSNYRRIWLSTTATTTTTTVQNHQRQRSCLRSSSRFAYAKRHHDSVSSLQDSCSNTNTNNLPLILLPTSSSSLPSKPVVVFNETMEVRYFTRSNDEVAIMKQCAADRRQQYKARRLRRRQQHCAARALGMNFNDFDDDDDECESLHNIDGYVKMCDEPDEAAAVVYRCGLPFQESHEGGNDEDDDEPSFSLLRRQQTATRGGASHHQPPTNQAVSCTSTASASFHDLQQRTSSSSNMLQDMVDEITGMISDVMTSVKRAPPRQSSSTTTTASELHPKDEKITMTSTSSSSLESPSESSMSPPFSHSPLNNDLDSNDLDSNDLDSNDLDSNDDEGPWLFSALQCGGVGKLNL